MKKVLIIEDDKSLLDMYKTALELNGLSVSEAMDGEIGLISALQEHPDLILLDILMPKMDGLTVMKKLRQDQWGKHVPIILLTNIHPDQNSTIDAIVRDQPAYYLLKQNVIPEDIVTKIKEVLEN